MSDSVQPHRWQSTRLPHPSDSPGKNTGVDRQCLHQCMTVKSESGVAQSCPTPNDPMDCSLPGSSIHGIFQARVLEWGSIAFSKKRFTVGKTGSTVFEKISAPEFVFFTLCYSLFINPCDKILFMFC